MKFKFSFRNGFMVFNIVISLFCIVVLYSCQKNEDLNKNDVSKFVIETYVENLQYGVDSVQLISNQHPVYKEAIRSEYFIKSGFDVDRINSVFIFIKVVLRHYY